LAYYQSFAASSLLQWNIPRCRTQERCFYSCGGDARWRSSFVESINENSRTANELSERHDAQPAGLKEQRDAAIERERKRERGPKYNANEALSAFSEGRLAKAGEGRELIISL
jgi:hypothetical protein